MVAHGAMRPGDAPALATTWRIAFWAMAVSAILVALFSWRFVFGGVEAAFGGDAVFAALLENQRTLFIAHIVAAPVALILGAAQFLGGVRARWPGLHRASGHLYFAAVFVGGVSGLGLCVAMSETRPIASVGFGLLAVLWVAAAATGIAGAIRCDFDAHRRWMIYAFAMTFSAVTLRVQLLVFAAFGVGYEAASAVLAWSCWIPNLIFAHWLLRRPAAGAQPASARSPASAIAMKGASS